MVQGASQLKRKFFMGRLASSCWTGNLLGAVWITGHQGALLWDWCEQRILRGDAWLESGTKEDFCP